MKKIIQVIFLFIIVIIFLSVTAYFFIYRLIPYYYSDLQIERPIVLYQRLLGRETEIVQAEIKIQCVLPETWTLTEIGEGEAMIKDETDEHTMICISRLLNTKALDAEGLREQFVKDDPEDYRYREDFPTIAGRTAYRRIRAEAAVGVAGTAMVTILGDNKSWNADQLLREIKLIPLEQLSTRLAVTYKEVLVIPVDDEVLNVEFETYSPDGEGLSEAQIDKELKEFENRVQTFVDFVETLKL